MHPFAAHFYDSDQLCVQKIQALSLPNRYAVRDLFDLDHLLSSSLSKPEVIKKLIEQGDVEKATEKIDKFHYDDFKEQILPYLPDSLMTLYSSSAAFGDLKKRVEDQLLEIMN